MDYWSEDFDADKNCMQENKIIELRNKVSSLRNKMLNKIINTKAIQFQIKNDKNLKNCRRMTSSKWTAAPHPSVQLKLWVFPRIDFGDPPSPPRPLPPQT